MISRSFDRSLVFFFLGFYAVLAAIAVHKGHGDQSHSIMENNEELLVLYYVSNAAIISNLLFRNRRSGVVKLWLSLPVSRTGFFLRRYWKAWSRLVLIIGSGQVVMVILRWSNTGAVEIGPLKIAIGVIQLTTVLSLFSAGLSMATTSALAFPSSIVVPWFVFLLARQNQDSYRHFAKAISMLVPVAYAYDSISAGIGSHSSAPLFGENDIILYIWAAVVFGVLLLLSSRMEY